MHKTKANWRLKMCYIVASTRSCRGRREFDVWHPSSTGPGSAVKIYNRCQSELFYSIDCRVGIVSWGGIGVNWGSQARNKQWYFCVFKETVPNLKQTAIACFKPDLFIDGRQKHGFDESRSLFFCMSDFTFGPPAAPRIIDSTIFNSILSDIKTLKTA